MSTFMISFRIASIGNDSDRRDKLDECVRKCSTMQWDETTSFYIIESGMTTISIAQSLKSSINVQYATTIIRSLDSKTAYVVGVVNDSNLFELIPYCKRL